MKTWTPDVALSDDRVRELALQPVERVWMDADGLLWSLKLEFRSDPRREAGGEIQLLFVCGPVRRMAQVPADTKLGELSHFDLMRLLGG